MTLLEWWAAGSAVVGAAWGFVRLCRRAPGCTFISSNVRGITSTPLYVEEEHLRKFPYEDQLNREM